MRSIAPNAHCAKEELNFAVQEESCNSSLIPPGVKISPEFRLLTEAISVCNSHGTA